MIWNIHLAPMLYSMSRRGHADDLRAGLEARGDHDIAAVVDLASSICGISRGGCVLSQSIVTMTSFGPLRASGGCRGRCGSRRPGPGS